MYRIGIGHDTHRLAEGLPLVLGGVRVESARGAEGHSDADALAHAVTDAVLGAMCEGDIGVHFPDRDPQWKDADSLQLLARVMWLAGERGYRVVNVDATVLLEQPRLRPYIQDMRARLPGVLGAEIERVTAKAQSGEGLDPAGECRAVTAPAVALPERT